MTIQELLTQYTQQQKECVQQLEQLQIQYHQLTGAIASLKTYIETETNEVTTNGETETSAE